MRPGTQYTIYNLSANTTEVRQTNFQPFSPAVTIAANSSTVFTPASGVTTVLVGGAVGTDDTDIILVPDTGTVYASQRRSPLAYTLKATDSDPRRLVGSFFGSDGQELRTGANFDVQFEMFPLDSALSLGQLYLSRPDANTTDKLWADCVEFRGMLYGGPLLVFPASLEANVNPIESYDPGPNFLRIEPGPVMLGGQHVVAQPALGPGYTDRAVEPVLLTTDLQVGNSIEFYADLTSCVVGAIPVSFEWTTVSGSRSQLQIQAFRTFKYYDQTEWVASVTSADELFSPPSGAPNPFIAFVELEEGFYTVRLTARNQAVGTIQYGIEKYR